MYVAFSWMSSCCDLILVPSRLRLRIRSILSSSTSGFVTLHPATADIARTYAEEKSCILQVSWGPQISKGYGMGIVLGRIEADQALCLSIVTPQSACESRLAFP